MDDHVCDPQLTFRINMSTSLREAAFIPLSDAQPPPGSERHEALLAAQLRVVDDSAGRSDFAALQQKLLRAVSWGDAELVANLFAHATVSKNQPSVCSLSHSFFYY